MMVVLLAMCQFQLHGTPENGYAMDYLVLAIVLVTILDWAMGILIVHLTFYLDPANDVLVFGFVVVIHVVSFYVYYGMLGIFF